ncbi:MAG: hypothetical protein J6Y01_01385 [Spirochaetales bacterium]|nr:hypothetical protein [Spirochaetales bacterium]
MKKIIITAISAIAVIALLGCQVYDQNSNETIYTAMNRDSAISWEKYAKPIEQAYKTNTDASKAEVLDAFLEYDAFITLAKKQVAVNDPSTDLYNVDDVKISYKTAATTTTALSTAITTVKAKIEAEKANDYISNVKLEGVSIKDLWDKEYKLKWDYNSKK